MDSKVLDSDLNSNKNGAVVNEVDLSDEHIGSAPKYEDAVAEPNSLADDKTDKPQKGGKLFYGEDENKERGNWSGRLDFLLACIGYAVGIGNLWRFPYLCYKNGGGAFLIPYIIMLTIVGIPLFFMELAFGQYCSLGPITAWKLCPLFKGVGVAMVSISAIVCIYYNVIIMYTIFYFAHSFQAEVPWATCDHYWNTPNCISISTLKNATNLTETTTTSMLTTVASNMTTAKRTTPAEEFFERYVLELSDGLHDLGWPRWQLVLTLLAAWVLVFLCIVKGVKSTGKVVYFTATFPYVMLIILLVRGATLPGALEGIKYYITPRWELLQSPKVWGDAAVQIFYSLGPGWGGLLTMASYNRFHNNCLRDAVIVSVVNCGTSIFAGFAIFSMVGYIAHMKGVPVESATASGQGLAFVAYPEGLATMPIAPLWSVCFFFMLITLGLDSQFAMLETVISALADEFAGRIRRHKTWLLAGVSVTMFLLGLPLVTRGGMYLLNLMDTYSASFPLFLVTFFEVIAIVYIYGYERFASDIKDMIGYRPNIYWKLCWHMITPMAILAMIFFLGLSVGQTQYNNYVYPGWAEVLGWLMAIVSMLWIPLVAVLVIIGWSRDRSKTLISPRSDWGPALAKFKRVYGPWPGQPSLHQCMDQGFGLDSTNDGMKVNGHM